MSHTVHEGLLLLALGHEDVVEGGQDALVSGSGHHQGAPGDAETHAEGGLVGAMAAHVADHGPQRPVLQFDGVVEVAAEDVAAASGPVDGGHLEALAAEERPGQQAPLDPGVGLPPQVGLEEPAGGDVGPAPLDGVADRPAQQRGSTSALIR